MIKKLLCCILAISIFALISGCVTAESDRLTNADGYVYTLDDEGNATIVGYTGAEKKLDIPSELDGHTLVCIGHRAFEDQTGITEINTPQTVKTIKANAFLNCRKLKKVCLNEGLETIETQAFQWCSSLKEINIPDSLTKIGDSIFIHCDALQSVKINPDHQLLSVVDGVLFIKGNNRLLWYPTSKKDKTYQVPEGTTAIASMAFFYAKPISVIIPESVTAIGSRAFDTCTNLKEINIPSQVRELKAVFVNCNKLENINVSEDNDAFESVDGVLIQKETHALLNYPAGKKGKSYTIPDGIEIIGISAFSGANLTEINIPGTVRQLNNNSFGSTKLKTVILPEGVEELQHGPFMSCSNLEEISLPYSLVNIEWNPFSFCGKLKQVNVPQDHPSLAIMDNALVVKDGMKLVWYPIPEKASSYRIPEGVKEISVCAFSSCKNLKEVIIPEGVERITYEAFSECKLDRVQLPASLIEIDRQAFDNVKTFIVIKGSYAENFVQAYHLNYEYAE